MYFVIFAKINQKNTLRTYLILFSVILISVVTSCKKDETNPPDPTYVSFINPVVTHTIDWVGNTSEIEISISSTGPILPHDVIVNFEIRTIIETEDNINMIKGVHYTLSADSFIVPANSNEGKISLTLLYNNIPFDKDVVLKINLLPGKFDPAPNGSEAIITVSKPYLTFVSFVTSIHDFTIEPDSSGIYKTTVFQLSLSTTGSVRPYDVPVKFEIVSVAETVEVVNMIEGTHFTISETENIIPANSNVGTLSLTFYNDSLPLNKSSILKIKLIPGEFDTIPLHSEAVLTINKPYIDIFNMEYFTGFFDCDEAGYGVSGVFFTLDPVVENRIHNTNFWDWPGSGATVYYDFSDDEYQTIVIPDQPFTFGDGKVGSVDGTGTYNAWTHTFVCDCDVWYEGTAYATHHEFSPTGTKMTVHTKGKKAEFFK
ncbi:MAG: hypothetical protein K9H64_15055 [Bacteroidales bacterium]|nr:hypothetical protein [Bacteroidales bacterium]MCF8457310.1 hypothetical protein [Bacteroidales bacterium]